MGGLIAFLLISVSSAAVLNPKFQLSPVNPALEGKPGVLRAYKAPALEVHMKSLVVPDVVAAERALEVNLDLIKGLYQPKKNPYAGEVTSLVQCDRKFSPKEFQLKCPNGKTARAIAGGAGERHAFGMCTKSDIRQVAAFFSCYDSSTQELTEVRLFMPYAETADWRSQVKKVQMAAGEILR